jgi:hypothetical protein
MITRKGGRASLYCVLEVVSGNVLIIVPVYVPGTGNVFPWNGRMPALQVSWKPTRGFGDNLKEPGNGVDRAWIRMKGLVVEPRDEVHGKVDMMQDVTKGGEGRFRRHRPRQRTPPDETRV